MSVSFSHHSSNFQQNMECQPASQQVHPQQKKSGATKKKKRSKAKNRISGQQTFNLLIRQVPPHINPEAIKHCLYSFGDVDSIQYFPSSASPFSKGLSQSIKIIFRHLRDQSLLTDGLVVDGTPLRVELGPPEQKNSLYGIQPNSEGLYQLFVGNLPSDNHPYLEQEVYQLFSAFGRVKKVDVVQSFRKKNNPNPNPKPKYHAFVSFKHKKYVKQVLKAKDSLELRGHKLYCDIAKTFKLQSPPQSTPHTMDPISAPSPHNQTGVPSYSHQQQEEGFPRQIPQNLFQELGSKRSISSRAGNSNVGPKKTKKKGKSSLRFRYGPSEKAVPPSDLELEYDYFSPVVTGLAGSFADRSYFDYNYNNDNKASPQIGREAF